MATRPLKIIPELTVPDGSFLDIAQHEIPDSGARYIQDAYVDKKGLVRQRGTMRDEFYADTGATTDIPVGLISTPKLGTNSYRLALMRRLRSSPFTAALVVSDLGGSLIGTLPLGNTNAATYNINDSKPALGGGVFIGGAASYYQSGNATSGRTLSLWKGAGKADYTTGTVSVTTNSPVVTGAGTSWAANLEPGMFLFFGTSLVNAQYLGVVKSVDSNTQVTLEANALATSLGGASYLATSVRGLCSIPWVAKGRITTSTASTLVNGGNTKFKGQSNTDASGTGLIGFLVFAVNGSQLTYIGLVSSVSSDTQVVLGANAGVSVTNSKYIIVPPSANYTNLNPNVGFLNTQWSGYQFYANHDIVKDGILETSRFVVSDTLFPDAVDLTKDGDTFDMPNAVTQSPLIAFQTTETGILACRENESYIIQGTTPSNFKMSRIGDDGCISSMAMVPYRGGAIFPGRRSIYMWDGRSMVDLLKGRAKQYWISCLGSQNIDTYRAQAFIDNNHYYVYVPYQSTINTVLKSGTQTTQQHLTWAINLDTGAITFMTNMPIAGRAYTPGLTGNSNYTDTTIVFTNAVGVQPSLVNAGRFFSDSDAFVGTDERSFLDSQGTSLPQGPKFFLETKQYDMGNPQQKKLWKQLQLWRKTQTSGSITDLRIEVFTGLDSFPFVTFGTFPSVNTWKNARVKFLVRSTHMGFRIFPTSQANGTKVVLGPWAIGMKLMRPGRV